MIRDLLERLQRPLPADEVRARLDGDELPAALDRLVAQGRARTAVELLGRLVALPAGLHRDGRRRAALRMRLGELLAERLEYEALPALLEELASDEEHGARAAFLLAEEAERRGDGAQARRLFERVLARDLDFPKARARHARLAPGGGQGSEGASVPTMAGLEVDKTAVSERYRLRGELGRGATATVYLARDVELGRDVALKLLHPAQSARLRAEARLRSFNEARMASALRHPGVVAILELDEERGMLVMELCAGGSLRDRLVRAARPGGGGLPPREVVRVGGALLSTLAALHEVGVVHRDLKPGNLLFRERPRLPGEPETGAPADELVLADFGLALLDESGAAARPAGTLDYLAPEARRGQAGAPADLYACGVILLELATGERPGTREEVLRGEAPTRSPLPPRLGEQLGAEAASRMEALLASLLDADPAARPSASQAAAALAALARSRADL